MKIYQQNASFINLFNAEANSAAVVCWVEVYIRQASVDARYHPPHRQPRPLVTGGSGGDRGFSCKLVFPGNHSDRTCLCSVIFNYLSHPPPLV